ncbi:hypothetical protein J2772_001820 [Chryseobacterium jejuense]|nr:hypothetical protein [Chryseobacterium jejuense]
MSAKFINSDNYNKLSGIALPISTPQNKEIMYSFILH